MTKKESQLGHFKLGLFFPKCRNFDQIWSLCRGGLPHKMDFVFPT
jgi:hypothetical protein